MEVYELDPERVGRFGVLDTHVSNASAWLEGERAAFPSLDLYEHDELGGSWTIGAGRRWRRGGMRRG